MIWKGNMGLNKTTGKAGRGTEPGKKNRSQKKRDIDRRSNSNQMRLKNPKSERAKGAKPARPDLKEKSQKKRMTCEG